MNHAPDANTAAEAYQGQFKFDFGELGLKDGLYTGPCSVGESIATQSVGFAGAADLVPLNVPYKGDEDILIEFAHHGPAPTAGTNAIAGLLYVEGNMSELPIDFWRAFPGLMPNAGGDSEANAAVTAAATAITNLSVPSLAHHIIGFGSTVAQDAAGRTAEDLVSSITFTSTASDFTPQKYPFCWKFPNLAGTLVGQGIDFPMVRWPAWIPTNEVTITVTPTSILATLVTDAHSITADVYYIADRV